MMNKIWGMLKSYKLLSTMLLIAVIALGLDILGANNQSLRTYSHILLSISAYSISLNIAWQMIKELRNGIWGVDILALAAIVTGTVLEQYWAATIVILMLLGGEALEKYAESRATSELSDLLKRAPQHATIMRGRKTYIVAASELNKNDKILIKPGEVVPADCVILEGETSVDESSLTGESLPVDKKIGQEILSGSVNIDGSVTARVIRAAKDSQYEQIINLVRTATTSQAPFTRLTDKFTIPFSILSFGIAGGVWVVTGSADRFLEVLVVATPCPLILAAPVGLISGMSRAARHGIIIKTGTALEKLANIKTLAFDKTGTLTKGEPVVAGFKSLNKKYSDKQILLLAASIEQNSNHILANAIVGEAFKRKLKITKARGIQELHGQGLSGLVGKDHVTVGRLSFMQSAKITLPNKYKINSQQTISLVAVNNQLVGEIVFEDEIRAETKKMLKRISAAGIKNTLMITGDHQNVAKRVANELGVTTYIADCLPGDKINSINQIDKKMRPIGFVGDGVNDAPVLSAADIGIALGAKGSTAASESADVVIMHNNIERAAEAVEIAKRTFSITKQTIVLGIVMSLVLMAIFATGKFKAAYGAAAQELVDITVILYALRAHSDKKIKLG